MSQSKFGRSYATISEDKLYRYKLGRIWGFESENILRWTMVNPSTADASEDDATIRKVCGFSKKWGYGGCEVYNLFALRSRDPKRLDAVEDPIGPENDKWLNSINGHDVILAWGAVGGKYTDRQAQVLDLLIDSKLWCLGLTKEGHPKHPLFVPLATDRLLLEDGVVKLHRVEVS